MNKQSYLNELNSHLKSNDVEDIEEIITEYDVHFTRKMADGYTEEEIAAKLGKPKEIAAQFTAERDKKERRTAQKVIVGTGLVFADIFVVSFFLLMISWVLVLGSMALSCGISGICLILKPVLPTAIVQIPEMPYIGGAILGISVIALGILFAMVTIYSYVLTTQMGRAYRRWHKNTMADGKYPPLSMHPLLKDAARRKLRTVALISLVVFGISFIIGFIVLASSAGSLGFWHVWHWFQ